MNVAYPLAAALAVLAVACTELGDVPRDRCGNGVVEAGNGEDCDGSEGCGLPDTATACRVLCDPGAPVCPGAAVCGLDGVCHAPGGELVATVSLAWTAPHLLVADTSGDGYPELVGVSNQQVEVHLGGPDLGFGALPAIPSPPLTGEPHAADLEGDGDADIVLPVGAGVFTLSGHPSTALDPFFYNSFPSPANGRMAGAGVTFADLVSVPVIAAHDPASGFSILVVPGDEQGAALFPAGRTVDELIGDALPVGALATGSLTVRNLALVFATGRAISLYDLDINAGTVRVIARPAPVMLPIATEALHGAWFADFDGDGHQDLVASVAQNGIEGLAVAWGNGTGALVDSSGAANQATVVWRADRDQDGDDQPDGALVPLHVAQVTDNLVVLGDENDADVIARAGLFTTSCVFRNACALYLLRASPRTWSGATVADINGDGRPDVIAFAAGQTGLDLLINTSTTLLFNDATVATAAAVERLFTGDFNGDTLTDIAYVDASPGVPFTDALSVSFGEYLSPPGAAVYMGSVGELVLGAELLAAGSGGVFDFIADLVMVTDREVDGVTVRGAAIAFGSTARRLVAPLLPVELPLGNRVIQNTRVDEVLPVLGDGDAFADLAVLTSTRYGPNPDLDVGNEAITVQHARFFGGASDGQAEELAAVAFDPAGLDVRGALWRAANVIGTDPEEAIGVLDDGRLMILRLDGSCTGVSCAVQVEAPPGGLADPVSAGTADADGDGDLDLFAVFRNRGGTGVRDAALVVWWNEDGFSGDRVQRFDGAIADAAIFDRDRDGTPELVVLYHDGRGIHHATYTAGGFTALQPLAAAVDGVGLHAADVNGDGLIDLVVVSGVERETPRELTVYLQSEARL